MKQYNNGQELNAKILRGVDILADNVGSTLGPRGRNVILFHKTQGTPVIGIQLCTPPVSFRRTCQCPQGPGISGGPSE